MRATPADGGSTIGDLQPLDPNSLIKVEGELWSNHFHGGMEAVPGARPYYSSVRLDAGGVEWVGLSLNGSGALMLPLDDSLRVPLVPISDETEKRRAKIARFLTVKTFEDGVHSQFDAPINSVAHVEDDIQKLGYGEIEREKASSLLAMLKSDRQKWLEDVLAELNDALEEEDEEIGVQLVTHPGHYRGSIGILKSFFAQPLKNSTSNRSGSLAVGLVLEGQDGELGFIPEDHQINRPYMKPPVLTPREAELAAV